MSMRPLMAALFGAAALLGGCGAPKDGGQMHEIRVASQSVSTDPRLSNRWAAYSSLLQRATGLPVKLYRSSDYNGVIQAFASNQVDLATLLPDSYANVDAQVGNLAAPLVAVRDAEGAMGYYTALVVKADSPIKSLADLKGHSLVYVDLNSTSGYLFPRSKMREQGFDPDTQTSKTGFSGGHTQSVLAVENGQFDAAVVSVSGGTPETGFTSGPTFRLAQQGLIKPGDFRIVWSAGTIPNSGLAVRTDRPHWFIDQVRGAVAAMAYDDPKGWHDIGSSDGSTYAAVDRSFYASIIKLRAEDLARHRGQQ
jgi:phosphonate transport system substrate-binding protein